MLNLKECFACGIVQAPVDLDKRVEVLRPEPVYNRDIGYRLLESGLLYWARLSSVTAHHGGASAFNAVEAARVWSPESSWEFPSSGYSRKATKVSISAKLVGAIAKPARHTHSYRKRRSGGTSPSSEEWSGYYDALPEG